MAAKSYVGKLLDGRYQIVGRTGSGGSARVYRAQDILMHRTVALKILEEDETEYCINSRSFETEVKAISLLSHRNIVTVYDVSMRGSVKYIVMELVEGITLREYLDFHTVLPEKEVIACTRQVLYALREAHDKGLVHRDIKPQNIMLLRSGQLKVADFGIARLPDRDHFQMSDRSVGTVHYISPEQATTNRVDARSDLYSLGIVMYEMATGVRPFDAKDASVVAMMQVSDEPMPPRRLREDLSPALEQVILRAIRKDPDARYESADAMLRALERAKKHPGSVSREDAVRTSGGTVKVGFFARLFGRKDKKETVTAEIDGRQEAIEDAIAVGFSEEGPKEATKVEEGDEDMKVILDRDGYEKRRRRWESKDEAVLNEADITEAPVSASRDNEKEIAFEDAPSDEVLPTQEGAALENVGDAQEGLEEAPAMTEETDEDSVLPTESLEGEEEIGEPPSVPMVDEWFQSGIVEMDDEENAVNDAPFEEEEAAIVDEVAEAEALTEVSLEQDDFSQETENDEQTLVLGGDMRTVEYADEDGDSAAEDAVEEDASFDALPKTSNKGTARTVALGIVNGVLAVLLGITVWYSGLFFGTRVPKVSQYQGEVTFADLPVYVDYEDSTEPLGTVLSQSPAAGYTRQADMIYLRVSSGPSPYAAPHVKNAFDTELTGNADAAIAYLTGLAKRNPSAPLHVLRISEASDTVARGDVIRYSLTTAHEDNPGETTILLHVSAGVAD